MQNSKNLHVVPVEIIHAHSLDRVIGGCGGYGTRAPYAGNAPSSMNDGTQYPSSGDASYRPGSGSLGSPSTDYGSSPAQTSTTGLMSLIPPLESLVQAIQAVERSLNSGSAMT